jgi:hypothetical protein
MERGDYLPFNITPTGKEAYQENQMPLILKDGSRWGAVSVILLGCTTFGAGNGREDAVLFVYRQTPVYRTVLHLSRVYRLKGKGKLFHLHYLILLHS